MKKLLAIAISSLLILTGCASESEFGEVSAAIQDSQKMQAESTDEGGLSEEEKQALLDKIAAEEALAAEVQKNTEDAEARNDSEREARFGGLIWPEGVYPPDCDLDNFQQVSSLDNLPVCDTFISAWTQVWEIMGLNRAKTPDIEQISSPGTAETTELANQMSLIEKSTRLWGSNFWPEGKGRVLFVNTAKVEDEAEWFTGKVKELGGLPYMFNDNGESWYVGDYERYECGALASQGGGFFTMILCLGRENPDALKITPHEFTHWYQGQFGELTEVGPLWFIEGSAEFYGIAIGMQGEAKAVPYRFYLYQGHAAGYAYHTGSENLLRTLRDITKSEFVDLMRANEDKFRGDPQYSYLVGGMATEALVSVFGHERVVKYMKSFADTANWRQSFEEVFGLSVVTFYEHLHGYVQATAQQMVREE